MNWHYRGLEFCKSWSQDHFVSFLHSVVLLHASLMAILSIFYNVSYNFYSVQHGSQHCRVVQSLVENFAEGRNYHDDVVHPCTGRKPNGLDLNNPLLQSSAYRGSKKKTRTNLVSITKKAFVAENDDEPNGTDTTTGILPSGVQRFQETDWVYQISPLLLEVISMCIMYIITFQPSWHEW